jgi:acyl carrier protein
VTEKLQDLFRTILDDDDLILDDEMTAADVPTWDSVAHITLMFTIEVEFGVEFDDDQLVSFRNVGELRRFLGQHATV